MVYDSSAKVYDLTAIDTCLQNGQRRGFGIPRQFLYSRYS
jgi:hypothetical protein